MERKVLFSKLPTLLHGGDYNPEQWLDREDILEEDIRMMKEARVNVVTLGVFSWSVCEPAEGEYHFGWLLGIMDRLYENGIYTILATPTGARPAWLDRKYPEAMRVAADGVRARHGLRHNHCMSSPAFRKKSGELVTALAEAAGAHPGLILWHISNELGGACFCPYCQEKFRDYLRDYFDGDIEALNKAWWTTFWSHKYTDFDEVEPPFKNGETSIAGLNLAWKRFTTRNMTDYMTHEIDIVKRITPDVPVTTNFMKLYPGLDYRVLAEKLDLISWDSYPRFGNDYEELADTFAENAFDHAVMRSMKRDRPFLLMESAPGLVNWHPFNKLTRPGVQRLAGLQAVACGSDSVQYFQWRKGRGSFEQYHGAVVDHLGRDDTRVFKEVARTGETLGALSAVTGSTVSARAAVLFDWDNRWAIEDMAGLSKEKKLYEQTCMRQYKTLLSLGIDTDVVSMETKLSDYALVAAPMLYLLKDGAAANLRHYVAGGGHLIATYLTGYVNEDTLCFLGGFPGDGLKDLFGLYSEEIDTLYPKDVNGAAFADGFTCQVRDFCETLKVTDADVVARYTSDFYADTPVVTRKAQGAGEAWYVGARLDDTGMEHIYADVLRRSGVRVRHLQKGVEYHSRTDGENIYEFYLNTSAREVRIEEAQGVNLLDGKNAEDGITLAPFEAAVLAGER